MMPWFDTLRDLTTVSVTVRMLLAVFCGGLVGIEREHRRRPAGFRTHILICLGAAMTTLTSQYLFLNMAYYTDIARLGAQVVAGIGFIGAGSIIVTQRRRVKGLTTAAGLWACAIIGLTCGAGFYEGALIATFLVLLAEIVFSKLEYWMLRNSPEVNLYIEYSKGQSLDSVINHIRNSNIKLNDLEITRTFASEGHRACAIFTLQVSKRSNCKQLLVDVMRMDGVLTVEEL
ncbi:MAG: MgtC/SapB family protein [Candidatus Fimivivens sp.]|nr:MgtC/SapB family protein [Candidatus Fimivivens sp.]